MIIKMLSFMFIKLKRTWYKFRKSNGSLGVVVGVLSLSQVYCRLQQVSRAQHDCRVTRTVTPVVNTGGRIYLHRPPVIIAASGLSAATKTIYDDGGDNKDYDSLDDKSN